MTEDTSRDSRIHADDGAPSNRGTRQASRADDSRGREGGSEMHRKQRHTATSQTERDNKQERERDTLRDRESDPGDSHGGPSRYATRGKASKNEEQQDAYSGRRHEGDEKLRSSNRQVRRQRDRLDKQPGILGDQKRDRDADHRSPHPEDRRSTDKIRPKESKHHSSRGSGSVLRDREPSRRSGLDSRREMSAERGTGLCSSQSERHDLQSQQRTEHSMPHRDSDSCRTQGGRDYSRRHEERNSNRDFSRVRERRDPSRPRAERDASRTSLNKDQSSRDGDRDSSRLWVYSDPNRLRDARKHSNADRDTGRLSREKDLSGWQEGRVSSRGREGRETGWPHDGRQQSRRPRSSRSAEARQGHRRGRGSCREASPGRGEPDDRWRLHDDYEPGRQRDAERERHRPEVRDAGRERHDVEDRNTRRDDYRAGDISSARESHRAEDRRRLQHQATRGKHRRSEGMGQRAERFLNGATGSTGLQGDGSRERPKQASHPAHEL